MDHPTAQPHNSKYSLARAMAGRTPKLHPPLANGHPQEEAVPEVVAWRRLHRTPGDSLLWWMVPEWEIFPQVAVRPE